MSTSIKVVIVDDEYGALSSIVSIVGSYPSDFDIVGEARSVDEAVEKIQLLKPELVFLDIHLKGRNGFEILEHNFGYHFEVIFVTAFDQYAIDAFDKQAISYLLKPVSFEAFEKAKNRALKLLRPHLKEVKSENFRKNKIKIPQANEVKYLPIGSIVMARASGSYCEVYTTDKKKYIVSKPLKFIEVQDQSNTFCRTHRSYLINTDFIHNWDRKEGGMLYLEGGFEIPVSRDGKKLLSRIKS